jgi:predicted transcriptional regulator
MTPQPISVSPEEAVSEAAFRMVTAAARHLPVVEHGRLVGILSARDLLVLHLSEYWSPGRGSAMNGVQAVDVQPLSWRRC